MCVQSLPVNNADECDRFACLFSMQKFRGWYGNMHAISLGFQFEQFKIHYRAKLK